MLTWTPEIHRLPGGVPKSPFLACLGTNSSFPVWPGVRPPSAAHAVRALHPFRLSVLRQRLLDDGGPVLIQHRVPAHEGEGEVRLRLEQSSPGFPLEVLAPSELHRIAESKLGGHVSGPRIGWKRGRRVASPPVRGQPGSQKPNPEALPCRCFSSTFVPFCKIKTPFHPLSRDCFWLMSEKQDSFAFSVTWAASSSTAAGRHFKERSCRDLITTIV